MKRIGHPLFNDEVYGGDRIVKGTVFSKYKQFVDNCFALCPRPALHAKTIGFHSSTYSVRKWYSTVKYHDDMEQVDRKVEELCAGKEHYLSRQF